MGQQWFPTTCDNEEEEEEDWDKENEEEEDAEPEKENVPTVVEDVPTTTMNSSIPTHIRLSTNGAPINVPKSEMKPARTSTTRVPIASKTYRLGTFSRLLISALSQLLKKHQLYKTTKPQVYATKRELRTANENLFFIRKIYITPSTVLYEGPYREETCAVIREHIKDQDRFIRVTFRDEGKIIDSIK